MAALTAAISSSFYVMPAVDKFHMLRGLTEIVLRDSFTLGLFCDSLINLWTFSEPRDEDNR